MITAYVGLPGQGKTLSMVNDLEEPLRRGIKVYTNTPFFFESNGYDSSKTNDVPPTYYPVLDKWGYAPEYLDFNKFNRALRSERNAIFALDEASILLSNYFWASIDQNLIARLAQQRKHGIHIFYTTQAFKHSLSRLRDLTTVAVKCEKHNLFGLNYFFNIQYDPEYYNHSFLKGSERERSLIMGRKFISATRARYLYGCYDTSFEVSGSVLDVKKSDRPLQAEP